MRSGQSTWGVAALLAVIFGTSLASHLQANYYDRLGVNKDATDREIRTAFKKMAITLHPDKNVGDQFATEKMVELNEASSVLLDPDLKAAYDAGGEEAVKKARVAHAAKGSHDQPRTMQDLHNFATYDADPQIEVLDYHSWEASHSSTEAWYLLLHAGACTRCAEIADDWRRVGTRFRDVMHVGAVNCDQNFPVCRMVGITTLPTVVFYPRDGQPRGNKQPVFFPNNHLSSPSADSVFAALEQFVLTNLPNDMVRPLLEADFVPGVTIPFAGDKGKNWVVGFSASEEGAEHTQSYMREVAMIIGGLVPVGVVDCSIFAALCQRQGVVFGGQEAVVVTYHHDTTISSNIDRDVRELAHEAMTKLEPLPEADTAVLHSAAKNILTHARVEAIIAQPHEYLVLLIDQKKCDMTHPELGYGAGDCYKFTLALRRVIKELEGNREFRDLTITTYNCNRDLASAQVEVAEVCRALQSEGEGSKPSLVLLKEGALGASVYHDRLDHYNQVLAFVIDTFRSKVHEISQAELNLHALEEKQTWFVDFFAPWCHHCRDVAPEWNLAAKHYDLPKGIHFGKINCELNHDLCTEHHIRGYPTFLLFHEGVRHQFDFDHRTAEEFVRFVKQTLEPVEYEFTTETYKQILGDPDSSQWDPTVVDEEQRWVVDFFAPWCSHCHVMSPKFREAASVLRGVVKFGKMNCELDAMFCSVLGIRGYPTIWRWDEGQVKNKPSAEYPGQPDPKLILEFALAEVPDYVNPVQISTFNKQVHESPDTVSWLVLFYSSKNCVDCDQMKLRVKALAARYHKKEEKQESRSSGAVDPAQSKGVKPVRLRFGSINCRESGQHYTFCLKERVKKYPSLVYYSGSNREQSIVNSEDTLKSISEIDQKLAHDRATLAYPFRHKMTFQYHGEL